MRRIVVFISVAVLVAAVAMLVGGTSAGSAFAADMPKEGPYDYTACYSGVSNLITFSKTHSAVSYEHTGTTLSNLPGGMFDKHTFRCVGMNTSFDGKNTATTVCESIDTDGDKRLAHFPRTSDGKLIREQVAGTGKYEGMVSSGTAMPLGPFPEAGERAAEQRGESVEPPLPSQPILLSQQPLQVFSYLRPVIG